jgi:hypothetical protein
MHFSFLLRILHALEPNSKSEWTSAQKGVVLKKDLIAVNSFFK